MLIIGDLSGIQDYLFEVRETGGKQAKSLRFRSLYIQLIAEAVGVRLLRAGGLDEERLIFSAAGKIAIDGTGLDGNRLAAVHAEVRDIQTWLRDNTHARLRLSVTIHDEPGKSIKEQFSAAGQALQRMKLRDWSGIAVSEMRWQSPRLLTASPPDADTETGRDAELGRQVTRADRRFVVFTPDHHGGGVDVAGLTAHFASSKPQSGNAHDLARLARHVPTENGQTVEFVDLASRSRGAPMLGVLKADADSLGQAIGRILVTANHLQPLRNLSRRLETFFASELDQQLRKNWSNLYTVFSGGDDLLLVGPWDIVLDFAGHLHQLFTRQFREDQLTISAGVAVIKPKFPLRLAARQADDQLEIAKSGTKNQCAALGGLWKWSDHSRILDAGKQLADWVDADVIQRGWLHTLLELALLQRKEGHARNIQLIPAMASSRLAYHIARNWPAGHKSGEAGAARRWADILLRNFDRFPHTTDPITTHLPSILRYAMLATRSSSDKE